MSCLESILKNTFGCKKPFRKNPRKYNDGDCERYDYLTKSGWKAYDKLIDVIYDLRNIGVISDRYADDIIDDLDAIASGQGY